MQISRSATCNSTCTMCSIQTIAMLRPRSSRIVVTSSLVSPSVRPPPISSRSSSLGAVASAREFEPLAVEQAERFRAPVAHGQHAAQPQRIEAAVVRFGAREPRGLRGGQHDVLEHRHAAERARDLVRPHHAAPAPLGRVEPGHVGTLEPHCPGARRKDSIACLATLIEAGVPTSHIALPSQRQRCRGRLYGLAIATSYCHVVATTFGVPHCQPRCARRWRAFAISTSALSEITSTMLVPPKPAACSARLTARKSISDRPIAA